MKITVLTQVYENYGAHDWDGKGECPQYWKAKGGHEYLIEGLTVAQMATPGYAELLARKLGEKVTCKNEYWEEYVVDWGIEEDSYLSWFEKSQLEYDGKIEYPDKRYTVEEVLSPAKEEA